jgi:hypothetical protein
MWDYLILSILYGLTPTIMDKWILPKDNLLLMPNIKSIIIPYFILGLIILLITIPFNMVMTWNQCTHDAQKAKSWGFYSGIKIGLLSAFSVLLMYIMINIYPAMFNPFFSISILPYANEIAKGFFVSLAGIISYKVSRIFIDIC